MPETIFTAIETDKARLMIYRYFHVKAVVSLPYLTFQPYTSTKTSLLFAQKKEPLEVKQYDEIWNKYQEEYRKLSKEITPLKKEKRETLLQFSTEMKEKALAALKRYLGKILEPKDKNLTIWELFEQYEDELNQIDEEWWVLSHTAEELDYPILMAHADEIGYKRLKSRRGGEEVRPNRLYRTENKEIVIDTENPITILDYIRKKVRWD